MNTQQPEALRLADELRAAPERSRTSFEAAAELRRLHEENERLKAQQTVAWPTMPPSKGQSPVLFEDGYAEGWAKCLSMCKAAVAASKPAQQQEPVEYWTVADGWVSEQAEVPAAAWIYPEFWDHCKMVGCGTAYRLPGAGRQPLYTSPPASKPLTDEQIDNTTRKQVDDLLDHIYEYGTAAEGINFRVRGIARAIEAAHGIKGDA